jgi:hypothetical protein
MTGDEQSPVASPRHPPTAAQRRNVQRAERVIGLAAPFLDLLLAVGDRISRAVDRDAIDAPAPARAEIEQMRRVGPGGQV